MVNWIKQSYNLPSQISTNQHQQSQDHNHNHKTYRTTKSLKLYDHYRTNEIKLLPKPPERLYATCSDQQNDLPANSQLICNPKAGMSCKTVKQNLLTPCNKATVSRGNMQQYVSSLHLRTEWKNEGWQLKERPGPTINLHLSCTTSGRTFLTHSSCAVLYWVSLCRLHHRCSEGEGRAEKMCTALRRPCSALCGDTLRTYIGGNRGILLGWLSLSSMLVEGGWQYLHRHWWLCRTITSGLVYLLCYTYNWRKTKLV